MIRGLLPRSGGNNGETWTTVVTKFPPNDHAAVFAAAAAAAAVLARPTRVAEEDTPPTCCPEQRLARLPGALWHVHLQPIILTTTEREDLCNGPTAVRRRVV